MASEPPANRRPPLRISLDRRRPTSRYDNRLALLPALPPLHCAPEVVRASPMTLPAYSALARKRQDLILSTLLPDVNDDGLFLGGLAKEQHRAVAGRAHLVTKLAGRKAVSKADAQKLVGTDDELPPSEPEVGDPSNPTSPSKP